MLALAPGSAFAAGQQLEGAFTVTNEGTQPLEFKISASCGCSFVRPMGGTLSPGASRAIRVGLRLPATVGSEKNTQVVVESNDPRQPRVSLLATARAPAPWEVSETQINFGYVLRRELAHPPRRVLFVRPGRGKHGLATSAIRLQVPSEAYAVASRKAPDGSLAIEVSLRRDLADGRYSAALMLSHAEDPAAMSISLEAEVGPAVSVVPARVRLRRDPVHGGWVPMAIHVLARAPGLELGPLEVVACPRGVHVKEERQPTAAIRRLQLAVVEDVSVPPEGLTIEWRVPQTGDHLALCILPPRGDSDVSGGAGATKGDRYKPCEQ